MRKIVFVFVCCCISALNAVKSNKDIAYPDDGDVYHEVTVYKELSSLTNPTESDWRKLQFYLAYGERSNIALLKDYESNARHFRLFGDAEDERPQEGLEYVNCDEDQRENCFIIYSSFNKNYPRGLKRLVNHLKNSDFKGHILWKLGGWPDLDGGSLKLAHVPYAFKVSMFREAQKKGYKKVLWLDTAFLPVGSINSLFDIIEQQGYFAVQNSHTIGPWMNGLASSAFALSLDEVQDIISCCGGAIGVDFRTFTGQRIIDSWYQAAENRIAFFSPRSDQNALSILLHTQGLHNLEPHSHIAHSLAQVNDTSILVLDRSFVNELSLKPGDRL